MKKYFKLLLCSCLLGVMASSCSNSDETVDLDKALPISKVVAGPEKLSVVTAGDILHINIEAKTAWTVTNDADWVKPEALSGEGAGLLNVSVDANKGTTDRTATLTVTSAGKTSTITISQPAEYYSVAQVKATYILSLPTSVLYKESLAGDVVRYKMYAVPTEALNDMSVSDKLSLVMNYGGSGVKFSEEETNTYVTYGGLNENIDYTLLIVGLDKDNRPGNPTEFSFKTAAPCSDQADISDIKMDENNWTVTPVPGEMSGCYVLRISDQSLLYKNMQNALLQMNATIKEEKDKWTYANLISTSDIALWVYQLKQDKDAVEGVECRYVSAGEAVEFSRTRKDPTKNVDGSLFISWCANEDLSQTSTRYYYREVNAQDFVNN